MPWRRHRVRQHHQVRPLPDAETLNCMPGMHDTAAACRKEVPGWWEGGEWLAGNVCTRHCGSVQLLAVLRVIRAFTVAGSDTLYTTQWGAQGGGVKREN